MIRRPAFTTPADTLVPSPTLFLSLGACRNVAHPAAWVLNHRGRKGPEMTNTRIFALVFGVVFLAAGIAGFIPPLVTPGADVPPGSAGMETPHMMNVGLLFGIFPVNAMHNIVHLLFGLWGLAASRSLKAGWIYACGVAAIYLILALMGMASGLQ